MKYLLTNFSILVLFFATVGCKKDAVIDPRDQYVGEYSMTTTTTRTATGAIMFYTTTPTTNIVVTKDSGSNQLRIIVPDHDDILATLDGPAFVIPQQTTPQAGPGQTYFESYHGDGLFSGKYLNFNYTVDAKDDQATSKTIITLKGTKTSTQI